VGGAFILAWLRTGRFERSNAARMSAARCGWTQRNIYFCHGQKCKRISSGPPKNTTHRVVFLLSMVLPEEIRIIKSQHPGGVLMLPVQKLVASFFSPLAKRQTNLLGSTKKHHPPGGVFI
jgi:hypothetical protein